MRSVFLDPHDAICDDEAILPGPSAICQPLAIFTNSAKGKVKIALRCTLAPRPLPVYLCGKVCPSGNFRETSSGHLLGNRSSTVT